ncbi:hypothetical protein [Humisphaera borealis]|uniref:Uncharacterized protein n=1 Tax=Humisphaera borealis TaxID=2807512 RepID=A0A7M2WSY2_9BACT|nr:hypothetical protein [Humisphaera borealis]QOV88384.1 hypothetical protein IPV69_19325 [Humisphaera borealis]
MDRLLSQTIDRANQVLSEPLAPGATAAQAKVILAERGEQARRLAASLVGQRVTVHISVADVVDLGPLDPSTDKSLSKAHKLAVKGSAVLPLPPQVEKDWKQRSLDVAADYNKKIAYDRQKARDATIDLTRNMYAGSATRAEAKRNAHLREIQADQALWAARATLLVVGDDADLARRRGGESVRGEAEILSVDFTPGHRSALGCGMKTGAKPGEW